MVAEGTLEYERNWPPLSLGVVAKSTQPNPLRCRNYANGPIEMVVDESHERRWLLHACVILVFFTLCALLMETNGSYFSKDISQSAMLFELMHCLGESIKVNLNGKCHEHIEKSSFSNFCLQVKKSLLFTHIFYEDMFGCNKLGDPDGRTDI